jgi:uncharacterized protein
MGARDRLNRGRRLGGVLAIADVATPADISGAVLLLPFQVSVLGTPDPAVTPTNLLDNAIATPGAVYQHWTPAPGRRPPS